MATLVLALAHARPRTDRHAARPAPSFRRSRCPGLAINLLRRIFHRRSLPSRRNFPSTRPLLVAHLLALPEQTPRRHRTLQPLISNLAATSPSSRLGTHVE